MIWFCGVKHEEVEDILETWLKVRSWVIFQWGVSEERERNKEEGVGRSSCIVFQIWGSLQRALPRSPGTFASLPLKCRLYPKPFVGSFLLASVIK